ncbi:hypothetical protein F4824DRAFT_271959 [Ustulina deusta]|nr:hypothetical protein F4824DRAFT_271959 [Ustulina deusta]
MSRKPDKLSEGGVAKNNRATAAQAPVINSEIIASERLGTQYSECLASFQRFLVRCSQDDGLNSSRGLEKCFEEYSRLKIWGHQKRAALKPSVPGSLAATLQGQPKLQGVLFEIYEQMIDGFHRIDSSSSASLAKSLDFLADEYNNDGGSETRSEVSDDSSTEDESSIVSRIIKCIFESIEELYRVSSLIRRRRLTGRYLRSTLSILDPTCDQEYEHVRQKVLLWQKQQKDETLQDQAIDTASQLVHFEEETATPEFLANRQSREKISNPQEFVLLRRLAASNIKRRRQLGYWDAYPYQGDSETVDMKSTKPASTAFTFSTVARSAIFPDQLNLNRNGIPQTLYAPTLVGKHATLRVPDRPTLDGSASSFECPYCHTKLIVEEMDVRENWKRHVFRDLRPYICTFPDCLDPERLFLTRHDWIYHEMQIHRRQWICQPCSRQYLSKSEMTEHLRRVHNPSIKDRELTSLLEMSERPIDEAHVDNCPFCHGSMSTKRLLDHMAGHMEELALFSLPQNHEDAMSHAVRAPQPEGLLDPRTPSPSPSSHPSYGSGNSQPHTRQSRFQRWKANSKKASTSEQQNRVDSGRSNQEYETWGGFFCCNCGHGPWSLAVDSRCQLCQHTRCTSCPVQPVK